MSLPNFEPVGFELSESERVAGGGADEGYQYALFRDGLARISHTATGEGGFWRAMALWRGLDGQNGVLTRIAAARRRPLGSAARSCEMWTVRCLVRQRAAAASRAQAILYSRWLGKAEAMANLMRRTLMVTSAPILSSLRRMCRSWHPPSWSPQADAAQGAEQTHRPWRQTTAAAGWLSWCRWRCDRRTGPVWHSLMRFSISPRAQ